VVLGQNVLLLVLLLFQVVLLRVVQGSTTAAATADAGSGGVVGLRLDGFRRFWSQATSLRTEVKELISKGKARANCHRDLFLSGSFQPY
jgi:hypothetical protein